MAPSSTPTPPFQPHRNSSLIGALFVAALLFSATGSEAGEPAKDASADAKAPTKGKVEATPSSKVEAEDEDEDEGFPSVAEQLAAAKKANAEKMAGGEDSQAAGTNVATGGALGDPTLPLPPPDDKMPGVLATFFKAMFMLIVVLGIAWLTLHKGLGKLMTRAQVGKRMQVVEKTSLDQRRALYLVAVDGKEFILGGGENGVVFLRDVEPAPGPSFSGALEENSDANANSKKTAPISTPLQISSVKDKHVARDDRALDGASETGRRV